ncbi:DinB family protein [Arthrobacter globiformis]|uniref:DinB family protein n=1 Tax=Arthrobacter globiformis TaxID=1665 RepID=UPI001CB9182A|nr:DinB family protein [Arthrobacter globiformis]
MTDGGREQIISDYRRACATLGDTLAAARDEDLRRRSWGTRWTNEELLFHMVFGYMVVQALLPLVKTFGHLPPTLGKVFARLLNAGTRPFDVVNYWGSRAASLVYNRNRMLRKLERVTDALARRLARESEKALALGMAFPTRWDPFFAPIMTLADVYAYPTLHFDFHAKQLSLPLAEEQPPPNND